MSRIPSKKVYFSIWKTVLQVSWVLQFTLASAAHTGSTCYHMSSYIFCESFIVTFKDDRSVKTYQTPVGNKNKIIVIIVKMSS